MTGANPASQPQANRHEDLQATQWIAGFTTGMSLADTFDTSGVDATIGGSLLSAVALLAVIGAVFAAFVPAPWEPELRLNHSR